MADFTPGGCAAAVRSGVRSGDPSTRALWDYHTEYLRVTFHGDGSRPSPMADGTVVYHSWQAAALARYYCEVYRMASHLQSDDPDERASARSEWAAADWKAIWLQISRDERSVRSPA